MFLTCQSINQRDPCDAGKLLCMQMTIVADVNFCCGNHLIHALMQTIGELFAHVTEHYRKSNRPVYMRKSTGVMWVLDTRGFVRTSLHVP